MLYLITGNPREAIFSMQPEQVTAYMENRVTPSLERLDRMSREKLVTGGVFAGKPGFAMIADVQSNEELNKLLASLPFAGLIQVEVIPLVGFASGVESVRGMAENLKSASGRQIAR